jgi:2-polyprenyl-3-methyl-5-hydroxy-6-metoxy-1,4-benzoquinol methylase
MGILPSWSGINMKNEDVAALEELEDGHWWGEERTHRLLGLVEEFVPTKGRVLEIGCGNGRILSKLQSIGFDCFGIEPTAAGFVKASELLPEKIFHGSLDQYLGSTNSTHGFDCILFFDVLEHMQDDEHQLLASSKLLKNGGFVIFSVPADPKLWSKLDEEVLHFRRYTKNSMRALLSSSELKIKKLHYWCSLLKIPIKIYRKVVNPSFTENIKKPSPLINSLLGSLIKVERLPIFGKQPGVSIFGVGQKSN